MINETDDFNLRHLNTFRMDIACSRFIEYDTPADLPYLSHRISGSRWMHIGGGSNLLFLGDYEGTILHSRILDVDMKPFPDSDKILVKAGAGVEMDALVDQTCSAGLWGLENLSGIPGEVGASAVQNVGAYGIEACDVIEKIDCYDTVGDKFVSFFPDECDYGYRNSMFKTPALKCRYIVTHVTYRLSRNPRLVLDYGHLRSRLNTELEITPNMIRGIILDMRSEKLPDVSIVGSAGSFFKNPVLSATEYSELLEKIRLKLGNSEIIPPHFQQGENVKIPAAWLIEKSGLKGYSQGNVATWALQPLVIVNKTGKARPEEITALEKKIIETVHSDFGITLAPEVEHVN